VAIDTSGNANPSKRGASAFITEIVGTYGLVIVVLIMIAIFAVLRPGTYLTATNLLSIATSQSITALLALAIVGVLIVGEFDLSFTAVFGMSQVLVIGLMADHHVAWPLACLIGLAIGVATGVANAYMTVRLFVSSFVTTLGLSTVLNGFSVGYSGGTILTGKLSPTFSALAQRAPLGVEMPIWYVLIIAVLLYILLEYTATGRHMRAVGGNRAAAKLAGISVGRAVTAAFVIAGVVSAFASIVSGSQLGSGQSLIAVGYLLPAYAGAFLGATTITPGRFNVWGTLVGVYLLGAGVSGLQQVGFDPWVQDLFNGAVLLLAVAVSGYLTRLRAGLFRSTPAQKKIERS
jgi:ribose transport system permease protein